MEMSLLRMIPSAESCFSILTPAMIKAVRRVNIGQTGNMVKVAAKTELGFTAGPLGVPIIGRYAVHAIHLA